MTYHTKARRWSAARDLHGATLVDPEHNRVNHNLGIALHGSPSKLTITTLELAVLQRSLPSSMRREMH
jgi:hypothetical protein